VKLDPWTHPGENRHEEGKMPTQERGQLGMDEVVVDSAEAEEALEERLKRKNSAAELRRQFEEADAAAKAAVLPLIPEDASAVRIGRFRITKSVSKASHREFDTVGGKVRYSITAEDDGE
jgi:hypothetical protein